MSQEKFEIEMYAHSAVVNKLDSRVIMEKLAERGIELHRFLIPYTIFKTGKLTDENYITTVNEFAQQFYSELEERYGNKYGVGFWFKRPVYQNTEKNINVLHSMTNYEESFSPLK
ncbi:MAG: hypothetical protein HYX60_05455 [Legionella longbeachae]|nr:hypothetical protein [Legionella longbeachae]